MTLKCEWKAFDGSKEKTKDWEVLIPAGRHEIERVKNPCGSDAPWLVLKGTLIGGREDSWRQWVNDGVIITDPNHPNYGKQTDWGEREIVIED